MRLREGQKRVKEVTSRTGMMTSRTKEKEEFYHTGMGNSDAGWYSRQEYIQILEPIVKIDESGGLYIGSPDNTNIAMGFL